MLSFKMIKYFIFVPLLFLSLACENTQSIDPAILFQEYVVVNSELNSGELFKGVTFTKTLPLGTPYDIKIAELKNVKAYLKINGAKIVPLHYVSDGVYKPLYDGLYTEAGETFELFAEYGETVIYSVTKIPIEPELRSVSYQAANNNLLANVTVHEGEVYGAIWVLGTSSTRAASMPELSIPDAGTYNINVRTANMPEEYRTNTYDGRRNIQVFSYDKQYVQYFNSIKVNVPIENGFMQGGGSAGWNVYGQNVIGMFIGVGKGLIKNVN